MDTNIGGDRTQGSLRFVLSLNSMSKSVRVLLGLRLAEIGLIVGQDILLAHLGQKGAVAVQVVCKELGVRPSTISKMTDRLVRKGLLRKQISPKDKRIALLKLTPEGKAKSAEVILLWADFQKDLSRCDPIVATTEMRDCLAQLDAVLRAKLMRLR